MSQNIENLPKGNPSGSFSTPVKLNDADIALNLKNHPDWSKCSDRSAITRTFLFDDFIQAWGFMSQVAIYAEKKDHHPEWFNVYNKVVVTMSTHSCSGCSANDFDMARFMDKLVSK